MSGPDTPARGRGGSLRSAGKTSPPAADRSERETQSELARGDTTHLHFECVGCGASLEYAPGTRSLRCPHCGTEQAVPEPVGRIAEHRYDAWYSGPRKSVAMVGEFVFACTGCGARTESDNLSDRCQFCDAPLVAQPGPELIAPEAVVPFKLGQPEVQATFKKWVTSRWFAPSGLKKIGSTEKLTGTYLPHWTYDAATRTFYQGERGQYYYTTEHYTVTVDGRQESRTRKVRHTRWSSTSGTVQRAFNDVLVSGTNALPAEELTKLEPWSLYSAVPYQPAFLSGYRTLRYDTDPDSGLSVAKDKMEPAIDEDCRTDIGGDEQRVHSKDTRYSDVMFKLMLLPVWIAAYVYAGTSYRVLVNAHTGEVIGDRPYSVPKIVAAVAAAIALIVTIIVLYQLTR
jgi:LSD1 subclass zinc finger protein